MSAIFFVGEKYFVLVNGHLAKSSLYAAYLNLSLVSVRVVSILKIKSQDDLKCSHEAHVLRVNWILRSKMLGDL